MTDREASLVDLMWHLERITAAAAARRVDLRRSGLRKSRSRKALNIAAGVLALFSAGAITSVLAKLIGDDGLQVIAALVAAISGVISLVVTAYFSDDEIVNRLTGSWQYLALRESVFRLVVNHRLSDDERLDALAELQERYSKLDELYGRYLSVKTDSPMEPRAGRPVGDQRRDDFRASGEAVLADLGEFYEKVQQGQAQQQIPADVPASRVRR